MCVCVCVCVCVCALGGMCMYDSVGTCNALNFHRLTVVNLMVSSSVRKMALLVISRPRQRQELESRKPYILW